jgi:radical SAM superfamily enzyme YgiQ (UPF0313 family)
MKTVLVTIPYLNEGRPDIYVPLGLISLATVMRQQGLEAEIVDINGIGDPHFLEAPEAIMSRNPEVVGFSTMCTSYPTVLRLARRCKEIDPKVQIILGGPQASATARETVEHFPQIDLVVRGECETTIVEVILGLPHHQRLARLPGLTLREGNLVISTPLPDRIKDLDALPLPDYSFFPATKSQSFLPVEVGRGCPFRCTFCSSHSLVGGFAIRSPGNLVRLLKGLIQDFGIRDFVFGHDGFNVHRDWLKEFCQTVQRENLEIRWTCFSRVDRLDEEVLQWLTAAGCVAVSFGVESGSPRMQRLIKKNLALERIVPTANLVHEHGIQFTACFIFGYPQERLEDLVQSLEVKTALNFVGGATFKNFDLNLLIPFKGSQLYEDYGHTLVFDDFKSSKYIPTQEDKPLIKIHPDLFSAFHHYHTPHLSRDMLARVPYLLHNLNKLVYTYFVLWQTPELGFPLTLLKSPLLLKLPVKLIGQESIQLADMRLVCRFIDSVVRELGFNQHLIFEVMKYDLAVAELMGSEAPDAKTVVDFSYDIISLVEEIKAGKFSRLPADIEKMDHFVYFSKKELSVHAVRMPNIFGLSPLDNLQDILDETSGS